jgi:glyoxylase-like metal-dependent hydrolase (beta-lactamase superfamily II)
MSTTPAATSLNDTFETLDHGIVVIDTGFVRPRFDAAYLMVEGRQAAFIDNGTNDAVPRLLEALARQGLAPEAVQYVIVTHVHLDHAGATGQLMRLCPRAKLVVHPRGARHMVDPRALIDGASAVYGAEQVQRTYGHLEPVDAHRVLETHDGLVLELGGRPLRFIDTPGHARHHHCLWDEASAGWFTGDTFGLSYPEFEAPLGRYVLPTTTPVQFEPAPLKASIARLLATEPQRMYLTHYGCVDEVDRLAALLLEQIDAMVEIAQRLRATPSRHAALKEALGALYLDRLRTQRSPLDDEAIARLLTMDVELNAQGLGVWLDRARG